MAAAAAGLCKTAAASGFAKSAASLSACPQTATSKRAEIYALPPTTALLRGQAVKPAQLSLRIASTCRSPQRKQRQQRRCFTTCSATSASTQAEGKMKITQEYMNDMMEFLRGDLVHLFDEKGIDKTRYDKKVAFVDPITKYDTADGYLFNIQMLRFVFTPKFYLHDVKQTGDLEITTRWTMQMIFRLLPWQPQLTFTGVSIMGINPETGLFNKHIDKWDSIGNNEYLSWEGVREVLRQCSFKGTVPKLDAPSYLPLKRLHNYEVRRYEPFIVAEVDMSTGDDASRKAFNQLAGYIFGLNDQGEKMSMTVPVLTSVSSSNSNIMSFVVPKGGPVDSLPVPKDSSVRVREEDGGFFATRTFGGVASDADARREESLLREALAKDGLQAVGPTLLARYNAPYTPGFLRRNEVLLRVDNFVLG
eukprot:jgi/Chlat1/7719/Chrsp66S07197